MKFSRALTAMVVAGACALAAMPGMAQQKVLKIAPHAFPANLDPINVTAYITRNHGYMIYDTLFATDEKGAIKPQMVANGTLARISAAYLIELNAV